MILIMGVTLFTSRVILHSLGVVNYGVYTVVGGIASMFNVMLGSMTDATQRFLTFEIGKGKQSGVNKVFSTSLTLHIVIGAIIILIGTPLGLWFLYNKLLIPAERLDAAFWVFLCSLASIFILIISIPYNALIIAHEKMKAFAYISVLDAILRLCVAYLLFIDFGVDKLILYALLMLASQTLLRYIYSFYCKRHFNESKYHFYYDRKLVLDFTKFASWTLFGNASFVFSNQGVSLLLGTFFMPQVNAARGIACQIQGALTAFIKNFQTAVNPQITKNYAAGNLNTLHTLLYRASKLSSLLVIVPLIPIFFEAEYILSLWLGIVPEYTASFARYTMITVFFTTLINPLEVAAKATGNIKRFESLVYGSKLFIIPVSYTLLTMGLSPISVFAVALLFEMFALLLSLAEIHRLINTSIRNYLKKVLFRIFLVCALSILTPFLISITQEQGCTRFLLQLSTTIPTLFLIATFGLENNERAYIMNQIKKHTHR